MTWAEIDWASLNRHRERFLSGKPSEGPYWVSEADVASYDMTFGERIGWKWDAVLTELKMRGWRPKGGSVLDWGCGSGIAGRRVVSRFGPETFDSLILSDHSPVAVQFAHDRARSAFPALAVSTATPGYLSGGEPIGLLVISHVLNELPAEALDGLRSLIARSRAAIWTEPGSRETSRALSRLRDELTGEFSVVAPCTHANACPILGPGNERHWCHHFAAPPSAIFADSNWVKFGHRAGIDLRSLPYSFVALDRDWPRTGTGLSRVIGRSEQFKPYLRLLNCDSEGLAELEVIKRYAPALYKELPKSKLPLVYQWSRDEHGIKGGAMPQPTLRQFEFVTPLTGPLGNGLARP
jgi:hypothetical protein